MYWFWKSNSAITSRAVLRLAMSSMRVSKMPISSLQKRSAFSQKPMVAVEIPQVNALSVASGLWDAGIRMG